MKKPSIEFRAGGGWEVVDKTQWGEPVVVCPVCKEKFILAGIKTHIVGKARNEIWAREWGLRKEVPHMAYLHEHAQTKSEGNSPTFTINIKI